MFVPGSRPDRFAKARAAGAALTVIDLEDAVADADKAAARDAALAHIAAAGADGLAIRINRLPSAHGLADLLALLDADPLPQALLVPMVESPIELEIVGKVLGARTPPLVPLIETPRGLSQAAAIGGAPHVAAMMFGGGDMAGELGVALAWEPLLAARGALLLAAAQAGVPAIDVPWIALDDSEGLRDEVRRAKALGFAGKAAIHPAQVAIIEEEIRPTDAQIAEAEEALAAYAAGGEQAIRHKGRMLEAPLVRRYRQIVAGKGSNA